MVAADVMTPSRDHLPAEAGLEEALADMERLHVEALPVVHAKEDRRLVGILDLRRARKRIAEETLRRRTGPAAA